MADTGATSPGTMADDDTVGTVAWDTPNNAKVSDNNYTISYHNHGTSMDNIVKIIKADGSLGSENKAINGEWGLESYISYGGASDVWGESWTAEDINDADFGVVLSVTDFYSNFVTHYLKATNFGFSIPTGVTINGILVEIEKEAQYYGMGDACASVDHIRITVYYTGGASVINPKLKQSGTFATATIKTKISGTFVEKPQKVKVGGAFV